MRKLSLITALSLGALLFVGCEEDVKEVSNVPAVPSVSISDGSLGDYKDMANAVVTENDLEEFNTVLEKAMSAGMDTESASRAAQSFQESQTIEGDNSGKIEVALDYTMDENAGWAKGTTTMKVFDYSDDGSLFLGGALGAAYYFDGAVMEMKMVGTVEFAGAYAGEIIFDCTAKIDVNTGDVVPSGSIKLKSGTNTFELMDDVLASL